MFLARHVLYSSQQIMAHQDDQNDTSEQNAVRPLELYDGTLHDRSVRPAPAAAQPAASQELFRAKPADVGARFLGLAVFF